MCTNSNNLERQLVYRTYPETDSFEGSPTVVCCDETAKA